jgi:amino acid transporter
MLRHWCRCISVRCGNSKCSDTGYKFTTIVLIYLVLPGFLNGCILLFVISASNSDLYIASRTLYSLALGGSAPSIIAKTDQRGVPIVALGISATFCCLAYMNVVAASATVFKYLYGEIFNIANVKCESGYNFRVAHLDLDLGITHWLHEGSALARWRSANDKCIKAQGIDRKTDLPYHSPLGAFGTWFALIFCILIAIFKISPFYPDLADSVCTDLIRSPRRYIGYQPVSVKARLMVCSGIHPAS